MISTIFTNSCIHHNAYYELDKIECPTLIVGGDSDKIVGSNSSVEITERNRVDTVLINYPLFCPKCKQESLIEAKDLQITVINEPDAKTQSR